MSEPNPDRNRDKAPQETTRRGPGRPSISNALLLDKALALFVEHGFVGTSIDAITQSAGMAKRTIYARYGDKANLFRAAVAHGLNRFEPSFDRMQALESDDPEATLHNIARLIVDAIVSPESIRLLRLIRSDATSVPEISSDFSAQTLEPVQNYLADLFLRKYGMGQASAADLRMAAELFVDVIARGPCSKAAAGMAFEEDYLTRHTQMAVSLFLHGLLDIGARNAQCD